MLKITKICINTCFIVFDGKSTSSIMSILDININFQILHTFLLLFAIGLILFFYFQIKSLQTKRKQEEQSILNKSKYSNAQEQIDANNKQILFLKTKLQSTEYQLNLVSVELLQAKASSSEENSLSTNKSSNELELPKEILHNTEIYQHLCELIRNKEKIRVDVWIELEQTLNLKSDNFPMRLKQIYPDIEEIDLQICYLIKIGMKVKWIAEIMALSPAAISLRRSRLFKKINGYQGSTSDFDKFIYRL